MNFLIKSKITEKYLKQFKRIYTFLFSYKANKLNIKKGIERRYNVSVKTVRTMILLFKKKSKYRKIKKVFIELKENQHIEV